MDKAKMFQVFFLTYTGEKIPTPFKGTFSECQDRIKLFQEIDKVKGLKYTISGSIMSLRDKAKIDIVKKLNKIKNVIKQGSNHNYYIMLFVKKAGVIDFIKQKEQYPPVYIRYMESKTIIKIHVGVDSFKIDKNFFDKEIESALTQFDSIEQGFFNDEVIK